MTNRSDRDKPEKSKLSPIIAGMAGAAAGALTVSLMDKDKRKKAGEAVKKTYDKAKNKAQELTEKTRDQMNKAADQADRQIDEAADKAHKITSKADREIGKTGRK
jgi:ElaB/YqjD/DUF883 family membrane-anchored ribosome-binding protein